MLRLIQDSIRQLGACVAAVACVMAAGCATAPSDAYQAFRLQPAPDGGDSVLTNARVRMISNHRPSVPERYGQIVPQVVVCAEPSPDVATSVANSFGVGISVLAQGAGSLSGAQVESLLQLAERTASIQALREQMYRACEAYSNGAINGTNYTLIMSRLNETIATLMLGEIAGGGFGRSLGATGGKGNAEASASLAGGLGGITDLDEATARLAAAEKKVADGQGALATAQQKLDAKTCADGDTACSAEQKKLQTDRDDAKAKLDKASGERDATKELFQATLKTATKAIAETSFKAGGAISAKPDEKVALVLARMQKEFIRRDPSQSLIEACVVELSSSRSELASPGAAQQIFDMGILPAERAHGLTQQNATAASFGNRQLYRSGLYEYCMANLSQFAERSSDRRLALFTQESQLEGREIVMKAMEVRAKAAQAVADALARCEALADAPLKSACQRKVAALDDASAAVGMAGAPAAARAADTDANSIAPAFAFDVASAACQRSAAAAGKVPALPPAAGKPTAPASQAAAASLVQKRSVIDKHSGDLVQRLAGFQKAPLRAQEGELGDKRAAVAVALDAHAREVATAELRLAEVKARQAAQRLRQIETGCTEIHRQYEAFSREVQLFAESQR